jgi:hypothetical protein
LRSSKSFPTPLDFICWSFAEARTEGLQTSNEYTNFNGLEGARTLKETLNSAVAIQSVDLDSQFSLAGQKYDAVFFSGNPLSSKEPFLPPRKPGSTHEILLR